MADIHEYKCPNCGGGIEFDSTLQTMKCPYCDTTFDVESLRQFDEVLNQQPEDDIHWNTNAGSEWNETADGMHVYVCKSCGGEIVGDETLAATECPYCGNPVVIQEQFKGMLKPDYVIPFKLDKEAAKKGLLAHLQGKKLLPKLFKEKNHIDEIKGIYVPFWLFSADANANIRYKATRVRTWSDSDYDYTETSHYSIFRAGSISFDHIPVDGSKTMADDLMESLEPFDFSQAVDFQTAYLSGYLADKYGIDAEASVPRANERAKRTTEAAFRETVQGYTTVNADQTNISLENGVTKYALYPVWLLNTTWNNQKFTFAMNGQTGKFVGNLPIDKKKRWLYRLMYAGIFAVIAFLIVHFFGFFG